MEFMLIFKAVISRLLFIGHGVYAVNLYYVHTNYMYHWFFTAPVALIVVEAGVTLVYRKGVEFKYFWPSGFLYISCLVPVIWMIELELLNVRIRDHKATYSIIQKNSTSGGTMSNSQSQQLRGELLLKALLGKNELRKKVCELGLIIGVIIGRWLIPRGTLTRDQLSSLLLGYVSNSADILEIFTTFEEPELFDKGSVAIAIMAAFTLSVYQFTLVTTATMESEEDKKERAPTGLNNNKVHPSSYTARLRQQNDNTSKDAYISEVRTRRITLHNMPDKDNRGRGRKISVPVRKVTLAGRSATLTKKNTLPTIHQVRKPVNEGATEQKETAVERRAIHGEVFQILVTLLMQDGPFFILRAYLIIQYGVASEMHIFFTCKNAIVSILLVYRLLILSCSGKDEETGWHREEAEIKLHNIQRAIKNMKLNDIESGNMVVG